ncbi:MAG: VOC family protein [Mucilaginibacter sp.]
MKTSRFITCTTHLPVINLRQTLDYYRDTLGFYDEWTEGRLDGGIHRDGLLMLFAQNPSHAKTINTSDARLNLLWFVDNIDEVNAEFKRKNIEIASPLTNYSYGLREFAFIDINGYYIRVAQRID